MSAATIAERKREGPRRRGQKSPADGQQSLSGLGIHDADDHHQHAAAGDYTQDSSDVERAGAGSRRRPAEAQKRTEDLAAKAATDDTRQRVAERTEAEVLEESPVMLPPTAPLAKSDQERNLAFGERRRPIAAKCRLIATGV